MPVGVYTTNGPDACQYVAENSDAEVIVLENKVHLDKYLKVWNKLPLLKYIVIYNDKVPSDLPAPFKGKVLHYSEVIEIGKKYKPNNANETIESIMKNIKPG